MFPALIFTAIGGFFALVLFLQMRKRFRSRLPPGPDPEFFYGNARQLAQVSHPWVHYSELSKTYGDVIYFSIYRQPMIVLNSSKAIQDLFERKAANFSDRPQSAIKGIVPGWDDSMVTLEYGPRWSIRRKIFHQFVGNKAISNYYGSMQNESRNLVERMMDSSKIPYDEIRLFVTKIVVETDYGLHVETVDDPYVKAAEQINRVFGEIMVPGRIALSVFPFLKLVPSWAPFAGFKKQFATWGEELKNAVALPFDRVKQNMADGYARPSFASRLLEDHLNVIDEESICWLSAVFYSAAVDTTRATLTIFMLAMVLNPSIQEKAQEEIDSVIGRDRLPTFEDKTNLPYVNCILKETLRWHLALPLSLSRRAKESFEYRGYHIPKGCIIQPNAWAITHDENIYPSPEHFRPERFQDDPPALDPRNLAFGFGRRSCPGLHYAEAILWIAMATLLATTRIGKSIGDDGKEITPVAAFSGGLVSNALDFECVVQPRSPVHKTLIEYAVAHQQSHPA